MSCPQGVPLLVFTGPGSGRTRQIELCRDYMVVGREPSCDVRLTDPYVSRTHAALRRHGSAVYIQDLGSTGGTFVGETAVTATRELHPGDVITFGTVKARFEPASAGQGTKTLSAEDAAALSDRAGRHYRRGIGNAAHDHYGFSIQQELQRRANILGQIAVMKTRARWLICSGFLVVAVGFIIIAASVVKQKGNIIQNAIAELPHGVFTPDIADLRGGLLGWALATVGLLLLAAGSGQAIAAVFRRRRIGPWGGG